ncbi:hypothetical protein BROUX41_003557 [Berkeleyomyces rouxiae]|uniref:uncharacterized protein n=1 Tax=Berkeleyomyces rouxiae TaxID=2035830 RepID=UPI003B81F42B
MSHSDSDDEPITLSSHALAALAEFNAEKDAREEQFAKLQAAAEQDAAGRDAAAAATAPLTMDVFGEDWNESQFWYADATARALAQQLLDGATAATRIAVVSAPSVFVALKNLVRETAALAAAPPQIILLEHDNRFAVFPEFYFYDFQEPFKLPAQLKGSVDRVICDPPFLSEDCQTKAAMTVRWLCKPDPEPKKLILCTGERMESLALKLYRSFGLQTTTFEPKHARGLSNEFYCYASFECDEWKWR